MRRVLATLLIAGAAAAFVVFAV
ncbi:MAG: hypothetical protein QOF29_1532, partial [bacterium]